MNVHIRGAREHNLKDLDINIGDGLTVVTGVSGSGKTSLVFDTLYHEARRRFLEVFSLGSPGSRLLPADVREVTGLGPAVAVGQNLLNRNPNSILATASGLHPFLRLLYARFGERLCPVCGAAMSHLTEDEIVERMRVETERARIRVNAVLVHGVKGSHSTLLETLATEFGCNALTVDGRSWEGGKLDPFEIHDIEVEVARLDKGVPVTSIREAVGLASSLGANVIKMKGDGREETFSRTTACPQCYHYFQELEPVHFNTSCPNCKGEGCDLCGGTGLYPEAASVRWQGLQLPQLLSKPVNEAIGLFKYTGLPASAHRLCDEINRRLDALHRVGLGYVQLDRPSPSLSRGESQRVRLAVAMTSRLEDILHVLDEPTIGQHPKDVARLLPVFRELPGPVVYVEHDRFAASAADRVIDLGPGAGEDGGRLIFTGTPRELWEAETPTGIFFSGREMVEVPSLRPKPKSFITIRGARQHNLRNIDIPIPLGRLTVITGVSGSGKSTLVEHVLVPSLNGEPEGCDGFEGPRLKPVLVDQSPIGKNTRSNPATYTKLSDIMRKYYARETGLSASHFSFNRPDGACPTCKGMGAIEVKMRYLPSNWIPCSDCGGKRFSDEVLSHKVNFGDRNLSISDFYELQVSEVRALMENTKLVAKERNSAKRILKALEDIGLGYIKLGQPSPTLSGGEAQRVKLAKYLGRRNLKDKLLILDEPSTGLHPQDLMGLLIVLDNLVRSGGTIVVVEHNTDLIRAADWVIELGPGAGPEGGSLLYAGPLEGIFEDPESVTARALLEEDDVAPTCGFAMVRERPECISIRDARANNLKGVDVSIPKGALTVVTGVSGSGKSSLVGDVLEAEARRRFLETLSLYERQGTKEGTESPVGSVTGLGVSVTVTPDRRLYDRRSTVGTATEIWHHLAVLLSAVGERSCSDCGAGMEKRDMWVCPVCGSEAPVAEPRHFSPLNYAAACTKCQGVGSLQRPNPSKLIVNPDLPLCGGAMHSPGFFPKGYLCKPGNHGYYIVRAVLKRYGFDPAETPWNEMTREAQEAFLFGDTEPLTVSFRSHSGRVGTREVVYPGFYGWVRDWDVGGTYTDNVLCPKCQGRRLRSQYLAVTLNGHNIHELSEMPLSKLEKVLKGVSTPDLESHYAMGSLTTVLKRLGFLLRVGLGYLNLNRVSATLSAGEAQRVKLAGLLGGGLTSLTVLLDEPSRGLHPSELEALLGALEDLRNEGNTVVVVEHDPVFIRAADYIIDMGPGAGTKGGKVVATGSPSEIIATGTVTGEWLRGGRTFKIPGKRRKPKGWLTIEGATENNLKGETVSIPIGVLVGICGISGSGKSTLLIDTLGKALAPRTHTTSVAKEPLEPGQYDSIEGAPGKTVLVDQAKKGIRSPAIFLGLSRRIQKLFSKSEDAMALSLDSKDLKRKCSACKGRGSIGIEMGFLPNIRETCEVCRGTGYLPEAWEVFLRGLSLPDIDSLTLEEVYQIFGDEEGLVHMIEAAMDVGLGYLVMRQPGFALSGGEAQRLKIAKELSSRTRKETLYILDEPTVGQHMEDVSQLVGVLHRIVDDGHSVFVVEHNPHLLASCDWLVELGPGGGPNGGRVIASGTPETLAIGDTPTAPYLREILEVSR